MNSSLLISDDVLLPEWFVKSAGLTEIKIISGRYPVLVNPDGSAELLVNIAARYLINLWYTICVPLF